MADFYLIQLTRGTTAQRMAIVPSAGQPVWDTDLQQLFFGNGVTEGGVPAAPSMLVLGKYRIKSDGTFQLWNADQSKFHTLTVTGAAGLENLSFGAGED